MEVRGTLTKRGDFGEFGGLGPHPHGDLPATGLPQHVSYSFPWLQSTKVLVLPAQSYSGIFIGTDRQLAMQMIA